MLRQYLRDRWGVLLAVVALVATGRPNVVASGVGLLFGSAITWWWLRHRHPQS